MAGLTSALVGVVDIPEGGLVDGQRNSTDSRSVGRSHTRVRTEVRVLSAEYRLLDRRKIVVIK